MPGLFQGLEIGKRALLTNQVYLQTIGHNIANVDTPGYTRQRVQIGATYPEFSAFGAVGTGVTVENIRQVRDLFLGQQFRQQNKSLGQWQYKQKVLAQVESLFNEPNDNTLQDRLNNFWNSWDDLAKNPNATNREQVVSNASLMVEQFQSLSRDLERLRQSVDGDLVSYTTEVNRLSSEIASVNRQIIASEVDGTEASDLRDRRDQMIDELSSIVDVNTIQMSNGGVRVLIGSMEIVAGSDSIPIETRTVNVDGKVSHDLVWKGTKVVIKNINGQLKGLLDTRDEVIPRYQNELDTLASTIITRVNEVHRSGYGLDGSTGLDFFDPRFTDAATMRLNEDITVAPEKIAASGTGAVGDGSIALAIQDLRNQRVMINGTTSINDYYDGLIGKLGVESHQAESYTDNFTLLVNQTQNAQQSVEGVSLDEEMANMIKFQHAYDAAARVITTMDQALDTVISGMGIVGR